MRRAKLKIARIHFAAALALLAAPVPAAVAPAKPPAEAPAPAPAAPDDAKPADAPAPPSTSAPAPGEAPKRSAADLGAWFAGWIGESGMPVWAWGALAVIAFLLLRGLVRRDDRRDLLGPRSSLRPGARPVAPRPRRPDPPQRL